MSELKKTCTHNLGGYLTKGVEYEVEKENELYVWVKQDDSGKGHILSQYWFSDEEDGEIEIGDPLPDSHTHANVKNAGRRARQAVCGISNKHIENFDAQKTRRNYE